MNLTDVITTLIVVVYLVAIIVAFTLMLLWAADHPEKKLLDSGEGFMILLVGCLVWPVPLVMLATTWVYRRHNRPSAALPEPPKVVGIKKEAGADV